MKERVKHMYQAQQFPRKHISSEPKHHSDANNDRLPTHNIFFCKYPRKMAKGRLNMTLQWVNQ